jgi:hypothetical protein
MSILWTQKNTDVFVSPRFERTVVLHVLKNILKKPNSQVPLLLGVHGPSGEGKTYQCEYILRKMGVKRFLISGGQLIGPIAGQPARLIRTTYIKASDDVRGGGCSMAAILINDFDTGLGSGHDSGFTINQQTMFGELMHLVDYPNQVEGHDTLRIPIIVTGNDFTKLYEPLVRAGRMTAFEWIPNREERSEIVATIFPELAKVEVRRLVEELQTRLSTDIPNVRLPVAFFSHLRSCLLDEFLWKDVGHNGLGRTVDTILVGNEPDFSSEVTYEYLLEKGLELGRSNQLFNNHLLYRAQEF